MDIIELLEVGYSWTAKRVAKVRPGDLTAATPCTRWDLRGLLNHTLGAMEYCAAAAANEADPSSVDAKRWAGTDKIGDDPESAFAALAERALAVWHTPGVLERTCAMPYGPTPASEVVRRSLTDVVVHGWDIARATGENADIPTGLAEPLLEIDRKLVHPGRRGIAFAAEVPIESDLASDRLVAFLGRVP